MEDPLETSSKLLAMIEEFGEVARLKINREKTKVIVKNFTDR